MSAAVYDQQLGGLKKILRKIAAPLAAGAAIAVGAPQLAAPAYAAAKGATAKKPKLIEPPVEPLPPTSFLDTLSPGDRTVLTIGGAVVGTLLLARLLSPPRKG